MHFERVDSTSKYWCGRRVLCNFGQSVHYPQAYTVCNISQILWNISTNGILRKASSTIFMFSSWPWNIFWEGNVKFPDQFRGTRATFPSLAAWQLSIREKGLGCCHVCRVVRRVMINDLSGSLFLKASNHTYFVAYKWRWLENGRTDSRFLKDSYFSRIPINIIHLSCIYNHNATFAGHLCHNE